MSWHQTGLPMSDMPATQPAARLTWKGLKRVLKACTAYAKEGTFGLLRIDRLQPRIAILTCCLALSAVSMAISSPCWARSASNEGWLLRLSACIGAAAAAGVLAASRFLLLRLNRLHARKSISAKKCHRNPTSYSHRFTAYSLCRVLGARGCVRPWLSANLAHNQAKEHMQAPAEPSSRW